MKPYYENENGKLYHGDCLKIMPILEKVDLALTDPPYGIGEAAGKNKSRSKLAISKDYGNDAWDNEIPSKECFELITKVSKNQIIFGGNYFIEYLKNSSCWLVWDKDNGKTDFADCELAWTNFNTAVRYFKYRWHGMLQENSGKHKEKKCHPTQKPVGLFKQILLKYSSENQTILDPFAGSGTTGLACEDLGKRKYILIEREEKYCEIIAKRIEAENKQLKLF
ncbi:MAG: site-specific DNA-methyltransferase [Desulfobacterales bacterium]|nr:site-specific DNA-methyltransferase [Desulfobacterales bacterium]